jgi:hypothetical protein
MSDDTTGPTGMADTTESTGPTGMADTTESTGPTGYNPLPVVMMPIIATGPPQPQTIATLDELLASRETVIRKEAIDTAALSVFLNPTRETFRAPLFQWAASGLERGFTVSTLSITPPPVCADGVSRSIGGYVMYCTGKSMEEITTKIQSMMTGIRVFHSFMDTNIRIHVMKD